MLLSGDDQFWESKQYALYQEVSRTGEVMMMLLNIRTSHLSYFEDEDRFQAIRAKMAIAHRPVVNVEDVEREFKELNLEPVILNEVLNRMIDSGFKADVANKVWLDLCQRRDLINESTWSEHVAKVNLYGDNLTPELEAQALSQLRLARYIPLEKLKEEFMRRLDVAEPGSIRRDIRPAEPE